MYLYSLSPQSSFVRYTLNDNPLLIHSSLDPFLISHVVTRPLHLDLKPSLILIATLSLTRLQVSFTLAYRYSLRRRLFLSLTQISTLGTRTLSTIIIQIKSFLKALLSFTKFSQLALIIIYRMSSLRSFLSFTILYVSTNKSLSLSTKSLLSSLTIYSSL